VMGSTAVTPRAHWPVSICESAPQGAGHLTLTAAVPADHASGRPSSLAGPTLTPLRRASAGAGGGHRLLHPRHHHRWRCGHGLPSSLVAAGRGQQCASWLCGLTLVCHLRRGQRQRPDLAPRLCSRARRRSGGNGCAARVAEA
jgi:hypothetical protein